MKILLIVIIVLILGCIVARFIKKQRSRLNTEYYMLQWKEVQGLCKDKAQWYAAVTKADKLLAKALKKRRFKGKSMGERMVSAQRIITNNDGMWFAHNMAKRIVLDPTTRLRENDVKSALLGFRQALKDVGALETKPIPPSETNGDKA